MDQSPSTPGAAANARNPAPGPYRVTIHVAAPGTPMKDGEQSLAGHMYYSITDGRTRSGYGFASVNGEMDGAGRGVANEHLVYRNPVYARTLEITAEQYASLREYGQAALKGNSAYFEMHYNVANNSCVDFVWTGLNRAGIHMSRGPRPGELHAAPERDYEGSLKPARNIEDVQRIAPPVPGSPHNREQRNPMPERTLLQRLLSEDATPDRHMPAHAAESRSGPDQPDHPEHARFSQIRAGVHALDAARGRMPDGNSERLSAGLLTAVAGNPLVPRVDEVVLSAATPGHAAGRMAFAVYRPFGTQEPVFHAGIEVEHALRTPVDEHFRQLDAQRQEHAQTMAAQQDMAPAMRQGPALTA